MGKQSINLNFSSGLDTKTDPYQVAPGKFLALQNSVFTKGGLLQKRNGYGALVSLPNSTYSYLTTLNDNLTAVSTDIAAYNQGSSTWVSKGSIAPMELSTLPLIRNNANQIQCDTAVAANGTACTVYTEVVGGTTSYKYVVASSVTGQNIVSPTLIPAPLGTVTGSPRVFLLGRYFIIVFTNTISSTPHLQYISVSVTNPTIVGPNINISTSYGPSPTISWDGYVANENLYIAYNTPPVGQAVNVTYLTSTLTLVTPKTFAGAEATMMSVTADITTPTNPTIYVSFYYPTSSTTGVGSVIVLDKSLNTVLAPVAIPLAYSILNITSTAANGSVTVFVEIADSYSYDTSIPTNYIRSITVTPVPVPFYSVFTSGAPAISVSSAAGLSSGMFLVDNTTPANIALGTVFAVSGTTLVLSSNTTGASASTPGDQLGAALVTNKIVIGSVGLASKAFMINGVSYFLGAYQSAYQPTYFLINGTTSTDVNPVVAAKLAYSNGGGYLTLGLPSVTVSGTNAQIAYLYKDLIAAVNKNTNIPTGSQVAGIYSQTGINLATFDITLQGLDTAEIAGNLHLGGGFLWQYDGYLPVEHNFFLWPDNVEATYTEIFTATPTGTALISSNTIVVSSATGIYPGMTVADTTNPTYITAGSTVVSVTGTSVVINTLTTHAIAGDTLTFQGIVTPTGTAATGSKTVTLSSNAGVYPGMTIVDVTNPTYIPAGTQIVTVSGTTITLSMATTHAISGDTLSIQGNIWDKPDGATYKSAYYYQVTYEWTDNQGNAYRSAPSIPLAVTTVNGSDKSGIVTLNIPTLRLTYKTANPVKVCIYRWSVAQQVYFQVTSIFQPLLNDTTANSVSFVDTLSDAQILGNNILYTNGGVVEDVNAPASNLLTLFDTRLWLVDAEDRNLLWYSKQVIEATPVEMSDLLTIYVAPTQGVQGSTGPITAIAPMDDKLIIFKKDAIYYINGSGPDNTGANSQYSQPIFITSSVGCANQNSIVMTSKGLMFQSDKGIWLLDRNLGTEYIGAPVEAFNSATVLSAISIPKTNEVRFTLDSGVTLMYDYFYGQWGTFVGIPGVSSTVFQGLHTYIDSYGLVYQETPGVYLDGSNPVLLSFTTSWLNLAGLQGYERFYEFYLLATYYSPHKLLISMAYDYNPSFLHSVLITPDNYSSAIPAGFGIPTPFGNGGNKEQWKIHAKKQLCESFQIQLNEVFDSSVGVPAGAGFDMSGLNIVYGAKKGYRPTKGANSAG